MGGSGAALLQVLVDRFVDDGLLLDVLLGSVELQPSPDRLPQLNTDVDRFLRQALSGFSAPSRLLHARKLASLAPQSQRLHLTLVT